MEEVFGVEVVRCGNCDRITDDYDTECPGCGADINTNNQGETQ